MPGDLFLTGLNKKGYVLMPGVFPEKEILDIIQLLDTADHSGEAFRKSKDLFAIRKFLKAVPGIKRILFTPALKKIIEKLGHDLFVIKSIYFDKPEASNWFVSFHQDLTVSVDRKVELPGFGTWTVKQDQFAVQPPINFLENIFTIRIHLDDTTKENGALKVIPGTHLDGICDPKACDKTQAEICEIPRGGIMIMKPLLLHASGRTKNNQRRRVIHLELSNIELPPELNWSEKDEIPA